MAADRSFAFVAPKGFGPIEGLKAEPGGAGQAPKYAVQEKLGKPAPDFRLTLLDGPNKTRTVTKAELAGKVVLIDFWATWCGPCLMELPEIQKLVEHYKDAKKDVLVVALSQDSEPQEISEVRKLVEKTLADKKIDLTRGPAGRIGLDPSNSVGKAFDVEGYPTLVILDGKGVVQSAHVGYNPDAAEPLHKTLATEIGALLEGKSLVSEKRRERNKESRGKEVVRIEEVPTARRADSLNTRVHEIHERGGPPDGQPNRTDPRSVFVYFVFNQPDGPDGSADFLSASFVVNHRRVPTGSRSRTVISRVPSSWL